MPEPVAGVLPRKLNTASIALDKAIYEVQKGPLKVRRKRIKILQSHKTELQSDNQKDRMCPIGGFKIDVWESRYKHMCSSLTRCNIYL